MAGVTFSEGEVKRLILALAGSKAMPEPEEVEKEEPEEDEKPEEGEGKPFGKSEDEEESTKDMLARKLREKGSK